ncbi:MFS transporter [Serratia rhizosphaerae]
MLRKKEDLFFLSVMIVTFMIGFDTTGLGVAIPDIAVRLGFGIKEGTWLSISYTAGFAAFLLPAGIITDKTGYRLTLLSSLSVFVLSSVYSTYCETLTEFTTIRLIQGISAAFLNTSAMALLNVLYPVGGPRNRAGAFKKWSMFLGLSFALGPILGSLIVSYLSWGWIMLINIPLSLVVLFPFVGSTAMETLKKGALGQVSLTSTLPATIILLSITMNPYFNQTFSGLGRHLFYTIIIACLIALGSLHLFSSKSFTRLPELKNGNFLISLLLPIFFSISYWSLFVTLPGYITVKFNYSPMMVMTSMLCLSIPLTLIPVFTLQDKLKLNAMSGFVFIALGLLALAYLFNTNVKHQGLLLDITLFIMGCGAAILNPIMARVVMDNVAPENSGLAAAITSTLRQMGFAVGVAFYSLMTDSSISNGLNISESHAFIASSILPLIALSICIYLNKRSQLLSKAH